MLIWKCDPTRPSISVTTSDIVFNTELDLAVYNQMTNIRLHITRLPRLISNHTGIKVKWNGNRVYTCVCKNPDSFVYTTDPVIGIQSFIPGTIGSSLLPDSATIIIGKTSQLRFNLCYEDDAPIYLFSATDVGVEFRLSFNIHE